MAILLKILKKAVEEYDRTQPDRDAMWADVWDYLDTAKNFKREIFDDKFAKYIQAEKDASRKLGEAMWAEPTNSNSYDKCVNLIDISTARKWIETTVAEYKAWQEKYRDKIVPCSTTPKLKPTKFRSTKSRSRT
jgi:hypothetical protein